MSLKQAIDDLKYVSSLKVNSELQGLVLPEYPFDLQLLSNSKIYEISRSLYFDLEGRYEARLCSTLRALSTQDLVKDVIEYSPSATEFRWFMDYHESVTDGDEALKALNRFNEISVFHEQNHRILWRIIPPPPADLRSFCRYLNFAESIVVALDMVLGDELGLDVSEAFERLRLIYRPGVVDSSFFSNKSEYRKFLTANVIATYYILEWMNAEDILKAVNYVLPNQKEINEAAVERSLELSENFSRITNPEWQQKYAGDVLLKLQQLHRKLGNDIHRDIWELPVDPLDLEMEFELLDYVFDTFEI